MKFTKGKDGDWYCHLHPFTFWIFEDINQFEVAWHYGNSTGSHLISASLEDAQEWCHNFALEQTREQLRRLEEDE